MSHTISWYIAKLANLLLMAVYLIGGIIMALMAKTADTDSARLAYLAVGICLIIIALFGSPYVDAAEFDPI